MTIIFRQFIGVNKAEPDQKDYFDHLDPYLISTSIKVVDSFRIFFRKQGLILSELF